MRGFLAILMALGLLLAMQVPVAQCSMTRHLEVGRMDCPAMASMPSAMGMGESCPMHRSHSPCHMIRVHKSWNTHATDALHLSSRSVQVVFVLFSLAIRPPVAIALKPPPFIACAPHCPSPLRRKCALII